MTQPARLSTEGCGSTERQDRTCAGAGAMRIKSEDLFRQQREVEIEHQGKIYRLRLTQLNKLILTA